MLGKNNECTVNLYRNCGFIFTAIHFKAEKKSCLPLILFSYILNFVCYSKGNIEIVLLKVHRSCMSPEGLSLNECLSIRQ